MPTVDVQGLGSVEFPDGMKPEDMDAAIRQHFAKPIVAGPTNDAQNPTGIKPQAEVYSAKPSGSTGPGNPLVGDSLDKSASFGANLKASLAPHVDDQIKHYSQSMNIPENRFGVIDGNIVYADQEGKYQRVTPSVFGGKGIGEDFLRLGRYVGAGTGPVIPQVAGATVGGLMGPTGASIPAAGATAAGVDVIRQGVSNKLLGRGFMEGTDYFNAAGQGVQAAAGQTVGVLANKVLESRAGLSAPDARKAVDPNFQADVNNVTSDAKGRGIDLTRGQATGLNSDLQTERQLGRFPETSDLMRERIAAQRSSQVPNAIQSEISSISPQGGATAINSFRQGAEDVATQATRARSAQAKITYATALDDKPAFITDELKGMLNRPSMASAWQNAQAIAKENGTTLPKYFDVTPAGELKATTTAPDWRTWDYIKRGLDASIESNTNALGRPNALGLAQMQTRRQLLGILDKANPDYPVARAAFGNASDAIDAIVNGGVGFVNKMDGMDRQSIVNRAFSSTNILPEEMTKMRSAFVSAGKEGEFNAGLSSFLSDRLDDAMKVGQSGRLGNVPGKFYASVWGDPRQQKVMQAAFGDPARSEGFGKFMEVLRRASTSLAEGSPTATDLGAMAPNSPSALMKGVGKVLSPGSWLNLGTDAVDALAAARTPAYRVNLANNMLSGQYDKQLAQLRMLSPTSEKAVALVGSIVTDVAAAGGKSATGLNKPRDRFPISSAPYAVPTTGNPQ